MFIDVVKIRVKSGNGGDGCVAFFREKFVRGPSGGDGGNGGSIFLVASKNVNNLSNFAYKKDCFAEDGQNGMKDKKHGKNGKDLFLEVPIGTVVKDALSGIIVSDMAEGSVFVLAKGGRGGFGNCHFATATRQAPTFARPGILTKEFEVILELKLIADLGLVGFPNVGKSTFLSVVSKARPKIANYHFTTLKPCLGVVNREYISMIIADIPGLIEGASDGKGLGHEFLRHIERTRMLFHFIDVSASEGRDPLEDFEVINTELWSYSKILYDKLQIVVLNKIESLSDISVCRELEQKLEAKGYDVFAISNITHEGIEELLKFAYSRLREIPKPEFEVAEDFCFSSEDEDEISVELRDGKYFVSGQRVRKLLGSVNLDDYESLLYFQKKIKVLGIDEQLKQSGVKEKDVVNIYGIEFEYVE